MARDEGFRRSFGGVAEVFKEGREIVVSGVESRQLGSKEVVRNNDSVDIDRGNNLSLALRAEGAKGG